MTPEHEGAAAPAQEPPLPTSTVDNPSERELDCVDSTGPENILGYSRRLIELGLFLFPTKADEKAPAVTGWQEKSTQDLATIKGWVRRGWNLGIDTEKSGVIGIDEDAAGHLEAWEARCEVDPGRTFTSRSQSGNRHRLYRPPGGRLFRSSGARFRRAGLKIDVKARGGLLMAPGSRFPSGSYSVADDVPIAELPEEVADEWLVPVEESAPVLVDGLGPRPTFLASEEPREQPLSARAVAWLDAVLDGEEERLRAAQDLGDGEEPRWRQLALDVANRFVLVHNAAPDTFPLDALRERFLDSAPTDSDWTEARNEDRWLDAVGDIGGWAKPVPEHVLDAAADFAALGLDEIAGSREGKRRLVVQRASEIKLRRVLWLWEGRMALGALSLLAGREGLGKSSLVMWLVAMITLGTLPGNLYGQPRAVIIAATEDSWEHTLVPRLIAAGADLDLVLRVDVMTSRGFTVDLSLPDDIPAVKELAEQERVALMVLDPIMSRLHGLDTHKDSEVRIALEPLVRMADETSMSLIGLIHLNKSSTDPLNAVMGSKAFTAVARSVSTVVPDDSDDDDRRRLFGTVKNNLGPALPASQVYTIETAHVDTEDGPMPVGKLVWHGEVDTTIKAAMADTGMDSRTAVQEARVWLFDFLTDGATFARKDVITAAKREGFSESSIKRAARDLQVVSTSSGFPRTAHWSLPEPFETDATGEES